MPAVAVIVALCMSVAVLAYLAHTDPKRRRVFGEPAYEKPRHVRLSLGLLAVPGILLLWAGDGAGLTIWLGALTVLGWGVAAVSPQGAERVRSRVAAIAGQSGARIVSGWRRLADALGAVVGAVAFMRHAPGRIAALEERVADLEAALERMQQPALRFMPVQRGTDEPR